MPHILVADDDAVQLDLHKMVLEFAGYQVDTAMTVPGALRHIQHREADVVIMDLHFRNASGEQDPDEGLWLIRRIRELGCEAHVIVLSGRPQELYGKPEENLVSRILMKPIGAQVLLNTIRDLVV